ncbi:MAG: hypothetical protein OEU26_03770, partial [Candidatus Tectomicrobia bacterium]|nr:hypothetical protein [Candidatus Tectomicrobia bacterium]
MKVIGSTMDQVSCHLVDERRSPTPHVQAATPLPTSDVLQCPNWLSDISVQLINNHFRGTCVLMGQHDRRWVNHPDNLHITFNIHLEQQCLQIGIPVRVAWNLLSTSGMLGIESLARSGRLVARALRYLSHPDIASQIKFPNHLDINRNLYFKVINIVCFGIFLSIFLRNKHLFL